MGKENLNINEKQNVKPPFVCNITIGGYRVNIFSEFNGFLPYFESNDSPYTNDIPGWKSSRIKEDLRVPSIYFYPNDDTKIEYAQNDGNKILLQRHPLLNKFGVPGGGIGMGETITQGLYREYREETGLKIKMGEILGVDEDYFTSGGEDVHGIFIYYKVFQVGGKILKDGNDSDTAELKFFDIKDLNQRNVQKVFWGFLKEYIKGTKS